MVSPTGVVQGPRTSQQLLALARFGVEYLSPHDRPNIIHHFEMEEKAPGYIAKVCFGEPANVTSVSLFYLEPSPCDTSVELKERQIPIGSYESYQEAYEELKPKVIEHNRTIIVSRELVGAFGHDFRSDMAKPITPQDFALDPNRIIVVHEEGDGFAIHVCYQDQVQVLHVHGSAAEVIDQARRWHFTEVIGKRVSEWIKSLNDDPKRVIEIAPGSPYPTYDDFEGVGDRVIVRADPGIRKFDLFYCRMATKEVKLFDAAVEAIRSIESLLETLRADCEAMEAMAAAAFAAAPYHFAQTGHTVTAGDFEGLSHFHCLIQVSDPSHLVYHYLNDSGQIRSQQVNFSDYNAEQGPRYKIFERVIWPHIEASLKDPVYPTREARTLEARHFIAGHGAGYEIDRIILQPDFANQTITAHILNPSTMQVEAYPVLFDEIPSLSQTLENLTIQCLDNLVCASVQVASYLGDRLWEDQANNPVLEEEDYRVRILPQHLAVEVLYSFPEGGIQAERAEGLSPLTVDTAIGRVLKGFQQKRDLLSMAEKVDENTTILPSSVTSLPDSPGPLHIFIHPSRNYQSVCLYYHGEGRTYKRETSNVNMIPELIQIIRHEIEMATSLVLDLVGLGQISDSAQHEVPPAPEGASMQQFQDLADQLSEFLGKEQIHFDEGSLKTVQDEIGVYIEQVPLSMTTRALHIVDGLKNNEEKSKDANLIYSVLKALCDATHHCYWRLLSATEQEYHNVCECWEAAFVGNWEEKCRRWIDQLKVGTVAKMVMERSTEGNDRNNHNMHLNNHIILHLRNAGIHLPPSPDVDLNDPYINVQRGGYTGSADIVARFKWAFKAILVDRFCEEINAFLIENDTFSTQIVDVLHGYIQDHGLTTPEDDEKIAAAREVLRSELKAMDVVDPTDEPLTEPEPKRLRASNPQASDTFADIKSGILQERIFELKFIEWANDDFTKVRVTPQGAKALLHQLKIIAKEKQVARNSEDSATGSDSEEQPTSETGSEFSCSDDELEVQGEDSPRGERNYYLMGLLP